MSDSDISVGSGFPVFGILGIILVILKVLKIISLSWFWVLAPFWIPLIVGVSFCIVVMLIAFVIAVVGEGHRRGGF